jgi:TolB protein
MPSFSVRAAPIILAVLVFSMAGAPGGAQPAAAPSPPPIAFGTNLGHWLSQAKLDRAEMATFFTEQDVARIKGWGMDHIRVPVDYPLFASETDRETFSEEGLSWIDKAVRWTKDAGLTLILDLHHLPGHHFMAEGKNAIWTDSPERRHANAIWRMLALRYKGEPHVILELLNEPVAPEKQDDLWHDLARELLATIRSVNTESWVMVGSNRWSNARTFATLPKFDDPRVVYTFHLYDPFLFTHQRASWAGDDVKNVELPVPYPGPLRREVLNSPGLQRSYGWMWERPYGEAYLRHHLAHVFRFRDTHQVPVYCGEFGVLNLAPQEDALRYYRDVVRLLRREGIGFSNWNYKSDNFGLVTRKGDVVPHLVEALQAMPVLGRPARVGTGFFDTTGDVGAVKQPGHWSYDPGSGAHEVSGSGANVWGERDAFYFASRQLRGDIVLEGDVELLGTGGDPHRKAGFMLRATRDADAPYADAVVHGDGLIALQYRMQTGGPTAEVQSPVRAPATLRLERHGPAVSLEVRPKGGAFQPVAAIAIALPETVHAGLAITAHDDTRLERARFTNVRAASGALPDKVSRLTESTLEVIAIATGHRRIVHRAREHFEAPNWSRDGSTFLFNQGGLLYTIPVAGGRPTRVDTAAIDGCNNDHGYSPDGTLIALSCGPRGESRIYVMPATGGEPRLVTPETPSYWHGWSPDGTTLAYVARRNGEFDIYTIPVEGGAERRITTAPGLDDGPDYTPDGQWMWFNSDRSGAMRLYRMRPDGSEQQVMTTDAAYGDWFPHPSPDGRWIVFLSYAASVKGHPPNEDVVLRLMPADGSSSPRVIARLFGGQGTINVPSWSPDSTEVAFVSYRLVGP